jgi:hypothetical protein
MFEVCNPKAKPEIAKYLYCYILIYMNNLYDTLKIVCRVMDLHQTIPNISATAILLS